MSDTVTQGVRIKTVATYVEDRSNPSTGMFFFSYRVTITNEGDTAAKLVSRHWVITDGVGKVEEVRGPGVVGAQPRLAPGDEFRYTSFCPLPSPVGTMQGSFQMVRDNGEKFDAEISPFTLAAPNALN